MQVNRQVQYLQMLQREQQPINATTQLQPLSPSSSDSLMNISSEFTISLNDTLDTTLEEEGSRSKRLKSKHEANSSPLSTLSEASQLVAKAQMGVPRSNFKSQDRAPRKRPSRAPKA